MHQITISAGPDLGAGVIPAISTPELGSAVKLKRGATREDGLFFWAYHNRKEDWVTREVFELRKTKALESYTRRWRDNPEKIRATNKAYRDSHKAEMVATSKACRLAKLDIYKAKAKARYQEDKDRLRGVRRAWEARNRDKRQAMTRARDAKIQADPLLCALKRLRTRLNYSVGRIRARKIVTRSQTKEAAEFLAWLAARQGIQNFGDYHIDHLRPLASLDLTNPADVALANAPENVQWLTKHENHIKFDHLPTEEEIAAHLRLVALWRAEKNSENKS